MNYNFFKISVLIASLLIYAFADENAWNSKLVTLQKDCSLIYNADSKGNIIPDFTRVGYHHGNKKIPDVKIVKTVFPVIGDAGQMLQKAIDEISALKPDKNGFRGTVLIKKGTYIINESLVIATSGVVLKGEGNSKEGTRLIASGKKKTLFN